MSFNVSIGGIIFNDKKKHQVRRGATHAAGPIVASLGHGIPPVQGRATGLDGHHGPGGVCRCAATGDGNCAGRVGPCATTVTH